MRKIRFIARLTLKAASRSRSIMASAGTVLACTCGLPWLIKHNGTAPMFAQVHLTYGLLLLAILLSATALLMACGSLSQDIETGRIQLVAVKPVSRWKIWAGKWVGIMMINAGLLIAGAGALYLLIQWRARQLVPEEQVRLHQNVLIARGSAEEPPVDLEKDVERLFQRRRQQPNVAQLEPDFVRAQIRDEIRAQQETVPAGFRRVWKVPLNGREGLVQSGPTSIRVRFHSARLTEQAPMDTVWIVGDRNHPEHWRGILPLTPGVAHEFPVSARAINPDGTLSIECENRSQSTLLFRLSDPLELLFPEGGFLLNYVRSGIILYCWLGLLTAVGLTASSFLGFPVAILLSLCFLAVAVSSDTYAEVIRDGTVSGVDHETGKSNRDLLDWILVPLSQVLLLIAEPVSQHSPIEPISNGRSIPWTSVGDAFVRLDLISGFLIAAIGCLALHRRDLSKTGGAS
ncbi:MAG: ABC transporter permease [Verrucomicrobiales bacterium]|nr:ABC transporter permease [Verrucomicrobiales bacterium]